MKPVVIVAGVGPGIGTSIARAFGAKGFAVALLARDSARLAKLHAEISDAGVTAAPFIVDLADSAATQNAVEQVRIWADRDPTSLVYNAFALQQGSADQLDGLSSLCAGKAALRMWVLTLAEDLAGTGIRVGTVTVHGRVERRTPFDPDNIAAALLRLHRGTKEGIEIHFAAAPNRS
jgi:NADP-dependent 3-hydroxy acid dehydrogenase YdfG